MQKKEESSTQSREKSIYGNIHRRPRYYHTRTVISKFQNEMDTMGEETGLFQEGFETVIQNQIEMSELENMVSEIKKLLDETESRLDTEESVKLKTEQYK